MAPAGNASSNQITSLAVFVGVTTVFETVTDTTAEVARLPAASRATAERRCTPSETERLFHERLYGVEVFSEPTLASSTRNCTPTTPMLSEALAEITTLLPDTVELLAGAVIATVGLLVSGVALPTNKLLTSLWLRLPA